jgi:hypothetical protein
VLSAAKLNNLLRNQGQGARRRRSRPTSSTCCAGLAGRLERLAAWPRTTGKAVGSNTVQNLAGVNILSNTLGASMGGSAPARAILGRLLQLPYGAANAQIQDRLGAALLDPKEAARLWSTPEGFAALQALSRAGAPIGYRTAPLLAGQ